MANFKITVMVGWGFSLFLLLIGFMNIFRGNDPGLGIIYLLLSVVFFPLTNILLRDLFGLYIPYYIKVILAILCIWTILAVGAIAEGFYPEIIDSL